MLAHLKRVPNQSIEQYGALVTPFSTKSLIFVLTKILSKFGPEQKEDKISKAEIRKMYKKVRIGRNERSSRKGISAWLIRCFELHTQLNRGPLSFLNTPEDDFFPLD